jgi:heterodisulfide reductase subunit A
MTAALALADQGFPVHLVEKTESLGGIAREIASTLSGDDVPRYIAETNEKVEKHPRIKVHLGARVERVDGHIGEFTSDVVSGKHREKVHSGVVVVATGAKEGVPTSYGYGQNEKVITQLELTKRLGNGKLPLADDATVVMIQCVEQRTEERPYCSRVCCSTAIRNALRIKELNPNARVMVLYRDIRTYGFRELAYREAREKGVIFVRFDPEAPPKLDLNGGLTVSVLDTALQRTLELKPDLVALAAPIVPGEDREEISELLRVPLNADGFFVEAHMKLRPVDFASEGLFLCGTAHAPKHITETISQAHAVAGRAATILSRKELPVSAQTAWVDPNKCISCMTCVHVCPYMAPTVGKDNKAEIQTAVCMGCGSCTSECPAKAIRLHHYVDQQILAAVDGLLVPESDEEQIDDEYPMMVGVATPRWHSG